MRLLISGGPGAGCTSTAKKISVEIGIPVFDSDSFFHRPGDPPFKEQYSSEERRIMLGSLLSKNSDWIVSGSVATWELDSFKATHGVFLNVPKMVRLQRLLKRQRNQFGVRVDAGGDMHDEHEEFIAWAAAYENRSGIGRNFLTDRDFLLNHSDSFMNIDKIDEIDAIAGEIVSFIYGRRKQPVLMRSNGYSQADHAPHAVTYRAVTEADFDELVSLRIAAMRESLERVGRFDPERARERLLQSFHPEHSRFVVLGECRIGFFTLRPVEKGFQLDHFYIHPNHQSRGIGSQVMADLLCRPDVQGQPLRLGALRGSAANRFYQHHGFVQTAEDEWDIYYLRMTMPDVD